MNIFAPQKSPKIVAALHQEIANIAPIHGVSIGDWNDKNTWNVCFKDDATEAQKNDVDAFLKQVTEEQLAGIE